MSEYEYEDKTKEENDCYELPTGSSHSLIWSVLSLALAALSVIACPLYPLGIALGVSAFGFCIYSRKRHGFFTRISVFGLILSIVGTVFGVFSMIVALSGIFG